MCVVLEGYFSYVRGLSHHAGKFTSTWSDEMNFAAGTGFELRPYQQRIIKKVTDMFKGEYVKNDQKQVYNSVVIESPTGSGKTCMMLLTAREMQKSIPGLYVCWFAMRRNLLRQAAEENTRRGVGVDIQFFSMFGKEFEDVLRAKAEGRKILVVLDEYQHDSCNTMANIHNVIQPDFVLGGTATPYRTDSASLSYQAIVKDAGIHTLITEGFLSQYDHYCIEDWKPETVARHYLADRSKWGKSLFYFVNTNLCQEFHAILQANGVESEVVTANSDDEAQIARFESGEIDVLINCMKLTEGFDCPALRTVWVRDSVKGPTVQMGGRVLRKFGNLPVKQIVQSVATRVPFTRVAKPRYQTLFKDGKWSSLTINPKMEQISIMSRVACASAITEMPQFITKNKRKKSRIFGAPLD